MSLPTRSMLFLITLIFLVACQSAPPPLLPKILLGLPGKVQPAPVLPNMLVEVAGQVEVLRKGRSEWVRIALGAELQPGDLLRASGQAAVFCGNETLWEASPKPVAPNKPYTVTCSEGRVPSPEVGTSFARASENGTNQQIPYALSPRSGLVLSDTPTLRFQPVRDVETYTVTLSSDDGKTRPPVSLSGNVLSYPKEWPPLQAGDASYGLRVEGKEPRTDDKEIDGDGFSLLADDDAQQVRHFSQHLRERDLSEPSEALLLASLYLSDTYQLHSEAVELLLAVPDGDQIVAVQGLLGQTYLEMGLLDEATAAYSQTLRLAEEASFSEEQAAAHLGLSLAACAQKDKQEPDRHKQEAQALYEQMGWAKEEAEALLAKMDEMCPK